MANCRSLALPHILSIRVKFLAGQQGILLDWVLPNPFRRPKVVYVEESCWEKILWIANWKNPSPSG